MFLFFNKFLLGSEKKIVTILDNASYHSAVADNSAPSKSKNCQEFRYWLKHHLHELPNTYDQQYVLKYLEKDEADQSKKHKYFNKLALVAMVEAITQQNPKKYRTTKVEEIGSKYNITVFFLPPYSPELNPIELLWSSAKRKLSEQWTGEEKIEEIEHRLIQALHGEGLEHLWLRRYSHCETAELTLQEEINAKDDFEDPDDELSDGDTSDDDDSE